MPKVKAATKKFQKHHLGRELTKRKVDQKKRAIREKSLAKYAPKEGQQEGEEEEGDEEDEAGVADEAALFSTKAKSKPVSGGPAGRKPAAAPLSGKPAAKKAPVIEDVDADVDAFLDGQFLDDDSAPQVDESALDRDDDEDEDEEDADMEGEDDEEEGEQDSPARRD